MNKHSIIGSCFALGLFISVIFQPISASAQYYVESGDTMAKIAKKNSMTLKDLISLNPQHTNPNLIHVGDYIVTRDKAEIKRSLTDYAKSLQDVTAYVYGGANAPYQTDCSGWVQAIYKKFNVSLPRTSALQSKTGKPITFKDLQEGDLMFFSTAPDKHITHVGIKLAGSYWISNLNEKSAVRILSTWGAWTQSYFMWGTRYEI
jgi:peptidoglycan DL-endopeptidase LytE